jgi:hypothetical protein
MEPMYSEKRFFITSGILLQEKAFLSQDCLYSSKNQISTLGTVPNISSLVASESSEQKKFLSDTLTSPHLDKGLASSKT